MWPMMYECRRVCCRFGPKEKLFLHTNLVCRRSDWTIATLNRASSYYNLLYCVVRRLRAQIFRVYVIVWGWRSGKQRQISLFIAELGPSVPLLKMSLVHVITHYNLFIKSRFQTRKYWPSISSIMSFAGNKCKQNYFWSVLKRVEKDVVFWAVGQECHLIKINVFLRRLEIFTCVVLMNVFLHILSHPLTLFDHKLYRNMEVTGQFSEVESAHNSALHRCTLQQCLHFWQLAPMEYGGILTPNRGGSFYLKM